MVPVLPGHRGQRARRRCDLRPPRGAARWPSSWRPPGSRCSSPADILRRLQRPLPAADQGREGRARPAAVAAGLGRGQPRDVQRGGAAAVGAAVGACRRLRPRDRRVGVLGRRHRRARRARPRRRPAGEVGPRPRGDRRRARPLPHAREPADLRRRAARRGRGTWRVPPRAALGRGDRAVRGHLVRPRAGATGAHGSPRTVPVSTTSWSTRCLQGRPRGRRRGRRPARALVGRRRDGYRGTALAGPGAGTRATRPVGRTDRWPPRRGSRCSSSTPSSRRSWSSVPAASAGRAGRSRRSCCWPTAGCRSSTATTPEPSSCCSGGAGRRRAGRPADRGERLAAARARARSGRGRTGGARGRAACPRHLRARRRAPPAVLRRRAARSHPARPG